MQISLLYQQNNFLIYPQVISYAHCSTLHQMAAYPSYYPSYYPNNYSSIPPYGVQQPMNQYSYPMYPNNPGYYSQHPQQPMAYTPYQQPNVILFYDDDKPYYELTNFARIGFSLDGDYWPTSEHYFQAQKFEGYPYMKAEVRKLASPRDAFDYVRKPENKSLIRKDWPSVKEEIMYKALKAKFTQNTDILTKLLNTNDCMLVEDSPHDMYWGNGADKKGKNRLGELLMKLRTELRHNPLLSPSAPLYHLTTDNIQNPSPRHEPLKRSKSLNHLNTHLSSNIMDDDEVIYDVSDSNHFLSNSFKASFKLQGKKWPTVLHYFVARKFNMKKKHVGKILDMTDAKDIHFHSRNSKYKTDIDIYWNIDKKGIMKEALKAKFEQNIILKQKLLDTEGKDIIERAVDDSYWSQLASGTGHNIMGQLLCQVRTELNTHPSASPKLYSQSPSRRGTDIIPGLNTPKTLSPYSSSNKINPANSLPIGGNILSHSHSPCISSNSLRNEHNQHTMDRLSNDISNTLQIPHTINFTDTNNLKQFYQFSTFSNIGFNLDGHYWRSVQHYFQAQKFMYHRTLMDKIRLEVTSTRAFEIGTDKANKSYIVKNWESIKEEVMFKALIAKFKASALKKLLLDTGDKVIINESTVDFWGSGKDGKGKNKLGHLLMKVRTELQSNPAYERNHSNSSYSPQNDKLFGLSSNRDVIEFYDEHKPYFGFTPYSMDNVRLDGVLWRTLNHYFQAQKFPHDVHREKINDYITPQKATYAAKVELKKHAISLTSSEKEIIMVRGLGAKFTQHPDLRKALINTGTRELLFIHPMDFIWGTGGSSGENKLGVLLMKLRSKLANTTPTSPIRNSTYSPRLYSQPFSSDDEQKTYHDREVNIYNSKSERDKIRMPPSPVTPRKKPWLLFVMLFLFLLAFLFEFQPIDL
ncbi:Riboflavin biosynthesis protein PYRR, chloroplastic-like [Oopsacas minuta]|uniref:Riboflavin biosynthesis protein PYRR, chloroplastic-like n=1 Tax=Oopsacas minuta TaxID=111878 RepID=A0AAV7K968_9METZ|nr:Riboflavin biosynthesis protein PYRR, chloroplastic-like [Oopsacas minuta]